MSLAHDLRVALDPVLTFREAFGEEPHDWQVGYLRETRPAAVLKGRQVGATQGAAALAIHSARYWPDTDAVIVSPSLKQSGEITTRARAGLRAMGIRLPQDSASMLRLPNGSRIISLPGTPRSVRGYTARVLIIDEAAYVIDETFAAARALVATGGRLVVQSTPADEAGAYHAIVTGDDPAWARYTVRSDEVPTISAAFLEMERRQLGDEVYAREYECQFARSGGSLFTAARLAGLVLPEAP